MYSATLLHHFEHPRNSGELPEANVRVRVENPVCADVLELALLLRDGVIVDVRFKAKGCVPSVACASMLTEMILGQNVDQLRVSAQDLAEALGGLPAASTHAAQLAVDAIGAAQVQASRLPKSVARHG